MHALPAATQARGDYHFRASIVPPLGRFAGGVAGLALLMLAQLLDASAAPAAQGASTWTLSLDGGEKQCRLMLRGSADGHGMPVAMPPGCHRAFPALGRVARWSEAGDALHLDPSELGLVLVAIAAGSIISLVLSGHLDDANGEPLLVFDSDGEGFSTTSPQGERLLLTKAGVEKLLAWTAR